MKAAPGLPERFRAALEAGAAGAEPGPWVVAVSGGLDSVALLHLLRFAGPADARPLVVAHFDHRMRADSAEDAAWVRGLCRAWAVPLEVGRADPVPASEAAARALRYAFLEEARRRVGGSLVLTAHHADDQAETVLFRALRGAGGAGLAGILPRREPALLRPLLGFWREELEAYARRACLSWREDPTNRDLGRPRNALRHRVLPELERSVAAGARRALARLAERAREDEEGWRSVLPRLAEPLGLEEREGEIGLDRAALLELHPAVRARILRDLAARLGRTLDSEATRRALRLAERAASGARTPLGGGLELRRELDRLVLGAPRPPAEDRPVVIPDARPGAAEALLGGRTVFVAWGPAPAEGCAPHEAFDPETLRFPLVVRARAAGDRIRLRGGSKAVKKLLLERRVAAGARRGVPVLVDAAGEVLWIPRVARAAGPRGASETLTICIG